MKLLPVAERELRIAARRPGTYWVRCGFAAGAVGIATLVFLSLLSQSPAQQAQALFISLTMLAFAYCLFGGALATADCVSEEKREGTLGLLFLTNLRGHDVIAGKMAASSLRTISGLVALLPVIGIPLLMGAVGGDTVRNTALLLANTMFLSLSLGVLVSVFARDPRNAIGGAIGAVLVLVVVLPFLRWFFVEYVLIEWLHRIDRASQGPEAALWMLYPNPVMLLNWSGQFSAPGGTPTRFWTALAIQHGMAWIALIVASFWVSRSWMDRVEIRTRATPATVSAPGATAAAADGKPADSGGESRTIVGDGPPFAWIVLREHRFRWVTWAGLGVIAGVWCWGYWEMREEWLQPVIALTTLFVSGFWLKFRLASVACRHLHEHRRSGALELVLCTAQTPATVVAGQIEGLRRALLPPLITVVFAGGLLMLLAAGQDRGSSELADVLVTFAAGVGILCLDLWTLAWAGLWLGMRSSRYVRAWALTVGQVLALPWALFVLATVVLSIAAEILDIGPAFDPGFRGMLVFWLIVAVGVDAVVLASSRRRLLSRFGDLALAHYGPTSAAASGKPS